MEILGSLLTNLAVSAALGSLPLLANGLIEVPRPKAVDINAARREALSVRPIVPYRAPVPYTGGRVRALFIGINYTGTSSQLSGCVNDCFQMLGTLQRIQFPISECCILVDDPKFPNFTDYPTRNNMIKYMAWLTNDVRPGDVLFFHYSGHGGQTRSSNDSEEAYDQTLCPMDYSSAGTIIDDDLFKLLVAPLPAGARMTCVFDCCHSATMLDLPFSFVAAKGMAGRQGYTMQAVRRNNFSNGDVVMFSGCDDAGTSADVRDTGRGGAGGAATQAFTWALLNTQGFNFMDILLKTRDLLKSKGFKQVPQLTSSKPIDLYKPFSLFGTITVNQQMMNQYVPQQYQQPPSQQYPPYPQPPPPQPYQQYPPPPQQYPPPPQQYPPPPQQYPPPPQQPHYQPYSYPPPQPQYQQPVMGYPVSQGPGSQPYRDVSGPGQYPSVPPTQYSYNPNPG